MVPRSFCLQNEILKGSVLIYRNQHIFVGIYMAMLLSYNKETESKLVYI